jgi:hypothetical protein
VWQTVCLCSRRSRLADDSGMDKPGHPGRSSNTGSLWVCDDRPCFSKEEATYHARYTRKSSLNTMKNDTIYLKRSIASAPFEIHMPATWWNGTDGGGRWRGVSHALIIPCMFLQQLVDPLVLIVSRTTVDDLERTWDSSQTYVGNAAEDVSDSMRPAISVTYGPPSYIDLGRWSLQ